MVSIAVLMTCFNRKAKTIACLQALYVQKSINETFTVETFLVDDGSTDGTAELVLKIFPATVVIKGTGNLYWNRGMNLAWSKASAKDFDYFLWLNDDTNLKENALNMLLRTSMATNLKTIICGAIEDPDRHVFSYGGRNEGGEPVKPDGSILECDTMNGNVVLVSRPVFAIVGNLDPSYPHAIGDFEYSLRAKRKGIAIVTTSDYIGYCLNNSKLPLWCYPSTPLLKRIKSLYSPLGNSHPYYYFKFENKYYGLGTAVKHIISIHIRVLIPSLWKPRDRTFSK